MDIFFYSNYCPHSQKILSFLVKGNLTNELNFICIDKRKTNQKTGLVEVILENGTIYTLPPNIHSVPALISVKQNYNVIEGEAIVKYFEKNIKNKIQASTFGNGEPREIPLGMFYSNSGIYSEKYTSYNMTSDELSAKGNGNRPLYNYVSVHQSELSIPTPQDNYRPDKVGGDVTIDKLMQQRSQI